MGRLIDTTLFEHIRNYFKSYLPNQRRCSSHTIRAYQSTLEAFMDFTKEQHNPYIGREFFDGRVNHIVASLESVNFGTGEDRHTSNQK